jgi:hypothetical protein
VSLRIWEAALSTPDGIELVFPTKAMAEARRFSLYYTRKLNRRMHPPNYTSRFDPLQIVIRQRGDHWMLAIVPGFISPDVQIIDRSTGQPIDLGLVTIQEQPSEMLQPYKPGIDELLPQTLAKRQPKQITAEEAARKDLESDANLTDKDIEDLINADTSPGGDEEKRAMWRQRRQVAKEMLNAERDRSRADNEGNSADAEKANGTESQT